MMPSKVTDLFPRAISDWFKGRRQTNTNGSVPESDTPETTPEREPERTQSPPAKRARYEPSASITNYYAPQEIISTPRPDDQATGPSGYRAEATVASPPSRDVKAERWPDLPRSGGSRSVTRINLFRRSDPKDNESEKKDAPSTPAATKRPHGASGSPFYPGRTMYGGAGASAMYLNAPNVRRRTTAVVAAPLHDVDNAVSSATQRLMRLLESCGTPPGERTVQTRAPAGLDSTRSASLIGQSIAPSFSSSYKTQELRVSHLPTLLRLKQGARLRESTRAARQMADANSPLAPYPAVAAPPQHLPAGSGEMATSTPWQKHSNKMKSQVGRNLARKGAQISLESEIVPPLNLPSGILNIDTTNLPKISFSSSSDAQIPKNAAVTEKHEEKASEFKFSKPTGIETQGIIPTSKSKFTFSKPEDISQKNKITNGPQKIVSNTNDFKFGFTKPFVKENGELPVKNWKCNDCWVVNKDESVKCIACGGSKPTAVAKPTESVVKEVVKDWQCKDCWVFNKDAVKNCIACGGFKPTAGANPIKHTIVESPMSIAKDWKCKDCWVFNKADVQKCIACGGAKTDIVKSNTTPEKPKDWKCQDCWIMNKDEVLKCVACGGSKPTTVAKLANVVSKNWQCKDCWVFNKDEVKLCIACSGSKPINNGTATTQSVFGTNNKLDNSSKWTCGDCWVSNDDEISKCIACGGLNPKKSSNTPSSKESTSSSGMASKDNKFSNLVKKQTEQWECATCLARNNNSVAKCACCEAPKPGAKINEESAKFNFPATPTSFKFGIPAANIAETEKKDKVNEEDKSTKGILNIDSSKSTASKTVTFTFGIPKPVTNEDNKIAEKEEAKVPKFSFGTPSKAQDQASFNLPGIPVNKTNDSAEKSEVDGSKLSTMHKSTTDKGTGSSSKLPSMSSPISFNFSANTGQLGKSATDKATNEPSGTNQVGISTTEKTSNEPPVTVTVPPDTLFGTPKSLANTQGSFKLFKTLDKPESSGTLFGISTNTTKTTEVSSTALNVSSNTTTTTATPLFGMPSTTVTTQVSSTLFGMPSNTTKTTESSSALFGIPSNSVKTTEAPTTLFGIPKTTDVSGSLFGKTSEPSSTLFGMPSTIAKTKDTTSSTLFGMPSNAAKTSEVSSSLFGIQPNVPKTTEAASTLFGMPSNAAKPSEATSTLFGMPSNTTKTTEATPTLFGMPSNAVKTSAATPTLFGMPSNVAKTSEASPGLFSIPSNSAKRSDTPTLFGVPSNASNTTEANSLAATTKASLFPASTGAFALPKVNNPPSSQAPAPLFSFGTNAQEPAKAATPSRFNFSFGGTSTETAPPSFNATFGASTTQQPSNPTPAVPSFAMPSSNMFGAQPQTALFGSNGQSDANKPPSAPNNAPFSFGSPSNTLFGAQPQTNASANATLFGAQGTMFGGSQTAVPSASSTLFAGQPANNNPAPMGMFGANMGGSATFGAAPSTNPSGGLGQAAAGQAPAFNFGATSTTPMFGFGQQAAPAQPSVYSFGGGAAPGVQFSLGTTAGTPQAAAPGARRVRKAVRRTQR